MLQLDGDCGRLQHIDAECPQDAFQRHQCGKPQVDEHDHRSQVAAPDAHQCPVGATGSERHPDAEAQSADDIREPGETAAGIEGLGQIQVSKIGKHIGADHRHRDREHPGAHAPPVSHVDHIGNGAHGAEVGLVGDEAEYDSQSETPPDYGFDHKRCIHNCFTPKELSKICSAMNHNLLRTHPCA